MNYEFVKTEILNGEEHALLFDTQKGVLYRVPVKGMPPQQQIATVFPNVVPYIPPSNESANVPFKHISKEPVPTLGGIPLTDEKPVDIAPIEEMPRVRSIVPPDFMRLGVEGGMQGEDTITRRT